ncbi:MAG: glycosyltransferase family 2 protein [Smithella sp.]
MAKDNLKEDQQVDLSVIIVNWNTKNLLVACLDSLSDQQSTYKIEIIVVDNASHDGSIEIVKEKYSHVILIRNARNLGFGKANNIGIKQSRGRYICLLNSDVRVLPDVLQSLINFMDQNKSIGISGPKTLSPDLSIQSTCRKLPNLWTIFCESCCLNKLFPKSDIFSDDQMKFFNHNTVRKVEGLAGCCLMIRKTALDRVGLFDEQFFIYFEETDLCKRFGQAGWDIVFFPDVSLVHHHGGSSSKDPIRFNIEYMKSQIKYWKKHNSSITVTTLQFILLMQHSIRLILRSIFYIFTPQPRKTDIARQLSKHYVCLQLILSGKYDSQG